MHEPLTFGNAETSRWRPLSMYFALARTKICHLYARRRISSSNFSYQFQVPKLSTPVTGMPAVASCAAFEHLPIPFQMLNCIGSGCSQYAQWQHQRFLRVCSFCSYVSCRSNCHLQSLLTFADIQRTCGLAEIGQAEDLCVHCMQASLLFGKIDQWVSQHCYLFVTFSC